MAPEELTDRLREMYDNAPDKESTTMIRLFGIVYANELRDCGAPMTDIAKNSVGHSYHAEISKGIRLARYVELKQHQRNNFT